MLPFSSYDNLVANIAETLNRQDLAAAIPGFVSLVEGEVNADDRFRVLPSLQRSTAVIPVAPLNPVTNLAESYIPMPADYISMVNFRIMEAPAPGRVEVITTEQMDLKRQIYPEMDTPKFYTIIGEEFELLPAADQAYNAQMIYYAMVPPLGTSNESNWLLARWPNVYYYGALLQAAPYLKNDDRIQTWGAMYNAIAEKIHVSNDRGMFSGSTMKMRTGRRYR